MYGTSTMSGNPAHKNYMKNWWDTSASTVGAAAALNIMAPLLVSGDFMDPALTQSDGIHPTPSGYSAIGDYIEIQ